LLFHSYAFDFSVWELWGALLHGGRLVVAPFWTSRSPAALATLVAEEQVSVLNATPSLFSSVQEELIRVRDELALELVVFGGEALNPRILRPWFDAVGDGGPRLVNMYGITETTVHVTYRPLSGADCAQDISPIGDPIPDLQLFLLDAQLNPVPRGAPGEIFVGGAGVARGYLNQPELTSERFIPNPFGPGRLYRSGDRARVRSDGELEFLGRIDDQIKIRGFRIELGEIETILRSHHAVAECAVVGVEITPDEKRLAAYVVPLPPTADRQEDEPLQSELRIFLEERLPSFMVPASLTLLPELPLTANGKLDRHALPAPSRTHQPDDEFVAPQTATEAQVAGIWCDVLGLDRVSANDNFFHVGGHSLLAARVVTRVRDELDVELSLRALFEHPTVTLFARHVDAGRLDVAARSSPPVGAEQAAQCPPSFSQQQLLFIDELASGIATYNAPLAIRIRGELDREALEAALNGVVERHESLRTVFRWEADGPRQVVLTGRRLEPRIVDLTEVAAERREEELHCLLRAESRRPFDLGSDLMLRATLFALDAHEHVALFVVHHIASDGWSTEVFRRDVGELYAAMRESRAPSLPELPLQYRDFALWQRDHLRDERLERELTFWRAQLAGAPSLLQLPTDRPRPEWPTFEGASYQRHLPPELADETRRLCHELGLTPYMLLLGVFAVLLYRLSGQDDLLVSSPFANRDRSEFHDLVGFFANTIVLRVRLSGNPPFTTLLDRVRETTLSALEHQELPFERLVEALRPERSPAANPLAQVNFRTSVEPRPTLELAGAETSPVHVDVGFAAFDLALDLHVLEHGIDANLL
jgi:acyl carrier protein